MSSYQLLNNTDCINYISFYLTLNDKFNIYQLNKYFKKIANQTFDKNEISIIYFNSIFNYHNLYYETKIINFYRILIRPRLQRNYRFVMPEIRVFRLNINNI